jgi:hypothetical protein
MSASKQIKLSCDAPNAGLEVYLEWHTGGTRIGSIYFLKQLTFEQLSPVSRDLAERLVKSVEIAQVHDGTQVDVRKIRSWIRDCEENHGNPYNGRHIAAVRGGERIPISFIDVLEMCIVDGSSEWEYLTLSYVWGRGPILMAKKAEIGSLKKRLGLEARRMEIPRVISDAIAFTRSLGRRYLWVDSLCIVQDDAQNKHSMINLMDIIYTRSFLTIIAASGGNSNCPLYGLDTGTRAPFRSIGWENGEYLVTEPPELHYVLPESPYERRGWTFRERLLSRSCLFFTKRQIYFQYVTLYREESEKRREVHPLNPTTVPFTMTYNNINFLVSELKRYQIPEGLTPPPHIVLQTYTRLGEEYTTRPLSYPTDILNEFMGISALLEQLCGEGKLGTSCYGLLGSMIDFTLLWYLTSKSHRRSPREDFPSWSWTGWECKTDHIGLWGSADYSTASKPLLHWMDPHIPEYKTGFVSLESKVSDFDLLENGQSQRMFTTSPCSRSIRAIDNSRSRSPCSMQGVDNEIRSLFIRTPEG